MLWQTQKPNIAASCGGNRHGNHSPVPSQKDRQSCDPRSGCPRVLTLV
nr:MAG TPA: hypothetical protein [Caudoviricetes sp.]